MITSWWERRITRMARSCTETSGQAPMLEARAWHESHRHFFMMTECAQSLGCICVKHCSIVHTKRCAKWEGGRAQ